MRRLQWRESRDTGAAERDTEVATGWRRPQYTADNVGFIGGGASHRSSKDDLEVGTPGQRLKTELRRGTCQLQRARGSPSLDHCTDLLLGCLQMSIPYSEGKGSLEDSWETLYSITSSQQAVIAVDAQQTLYVKSSDLNLDDNCEAHRTDDYISDDLIVRRGDPFSIKLVFGRPVEPKDNLKWWAKTDWPGSNSKILVPITSSSTGKPWSVKSDVDNGSSMTVTITTAADAAIGRYEMGVQVSSRISNVTLKLGKFILLFNPWCKDDAVYMKDDAGRNEYVLNESGIIFYGSAQPNPFYRPWDFGQFQKGILNVCLRILDASIEHQKNAVYDASHRGDPAYVGRVLSAMVNAQDDNGIITGNWSGDYSGGVEPTAWNGSVAILLQWDRKGPVGFGQCWVYAGVLCTVLRCLGIPARVISNFASAHDTDGDLNIDHFYDGNGRPMKDKDSIWNFHAWNEGWFTRKDLSDSSYDGWQVLDATPQEESAGAYRLGPCSVHAIKEGDIDRPYDARFVFSEVNGDVVWWQIRDHKRSMLRKDITAVGKFISTKAIGSNGRQDVTDYYKYPEGTPKEREVYQKAQLIINNSFIRPSLDAASSSHSFSVAVDPRPKLSLEGAIKHEDPHIGQDVAYTLNLKNTSAKKVSLQIKMTATAIMHTNTPVNDIDHKVQLASLEPNEEKLLPFTIQYEQYAGKLTADHMISVACLCEATEGGEQPVIFNVVLTLKSSSIVIKGPDTAKINQLISLEVTFTNPLPEPVASITMTVEGSGLVQAPEKTKLKSLQSNQEVKIMLSITPYGTAGLKNLIVDFYSPQFSNVKATWPLQVTSD
ncbi:protein-glutamine gamma-glutamyltransferase E-like [Hyperolius riggenbachi]|uniref:protein-glutamine gamma-glutamyltransferase E-like n=1 Tax=Hyperolius riggenbachi TaxID=752182 RepID=UPI0035A3CFD0